jgi:hypothetical protein
MPPAGGPGFEPGTRTPKAPVIPFHHPPTCSPKQAYMAQRSLSTDSRAAGARHGTGCGARARVNLLRPRSVDRANADISWQGDDAGLEEHKLASNPGTRCLQTSHRLRRVPRGASRHRLPTAAACQRARRAVAGPALRVLLARRRDRLAPGSTVSRARTDRRNGRSRPCRLARQGRRGLESADLKLSGVLTTCSRQAHWRRSRALSDPAATGHSQASSLGPSVSSPPRYCRDWALGPGTWPPDSVSSPHRYCRNHGGEAKLAEPPQFQALIGTVETARPTASRASACSVSSPHRYCRNKIFASDMPSVAKFQALIGTVETYRAPNTSTYRGGFQALIGTVET